MDDPIPETASPATDRLPGVRQSTRQVSSGKPDRDTALPGRPAPARDTAASKLLGNRPWLVLGGGGLRGLAHIGVLRRLRRSSVQPVGIVGCSIGALVGAAFAVGTDPREMLRIAIRLRSRDIIRINRRAVWVNGIKAVSVFRGAPLRDYIEELLGGRNWADLRLPLLVNAVDLGTGNVTWFGSGARTDVSLAEAVYASSALPVLYPPLEAGGAYYVDGGLGDPLPYERPRAEGATGLILVDVHGGEAPGGGRKAVARGLVAVHQRALQIVMARQLRAQELATCAQLPSILVRPSVDAYDTFDFTAIPEFLKAGYRAAHRALHGVGEDGAGQLIPQGQPTRSR